ncbi:MAG: LD-carboxypeptidase, partial [Bacteroidetes bacterium]
RNDLVGLVTPSSSIKPEKLQETVKKLEGLGYRVYYKQSVMDEYGYLAGKDIDRADEIMHMFSNKEVDAIFCVRGGYGAIRILELLDYEVIRHNPKLLLGYSDITALHAAIYKKTGLVSFHSPLGVSDFNSFALTSFNKVIVEPRNNYKYDYLREAKTEGNPEFDLYTIRSGKVEGELAGGNISVLDSMIGTDFEPDFKDKIVYLEEIEEKTYKVDKMLFHLLSATNLKQSAGIVLGVFKDCNVNDEPRISIKQALDDLLKPLGMPVLYGLSFGHIDHKITIPFGIHGRMNTNDNSLELLEKAVL